MSEKVGIVLEGGAMRGMFTAGILDVFMENRIDFDGAIGVSAGAVFGCNLKSRQIGRTVRYNKKYCRDWRYVSFRSMLLTGDLYGAEFDYHELPEKLDPFDVKTFAANPMEFWAVCTDADTGRAYYHKFSGGFGEDMSVFQASASMPIVSRAVEIEGRRYLDGGISDSIPLAAFENRGYTKNVVILTQPESYRKTPMKHGRAMAALLRNYPAVRDVLADRHNIYNLEVEYARKREKEGAVLIICPEESLNIGHMCKDPEELERVYRIGRKTGEACLDRVKAFVGPDRVAACDLPYTREKLAAGQI